MSIDTKLGNLTFSGSDTVSDNRRMHGILEWSIKAGRKIIIFTEALVLLSLFSKFSLIRNVNAVNDRIESLKIEVIERQDVETRFRSVVDDINKIKEVESSRIDWDSRVKKITSYIPDDMTLTTTTYTKSTVEIKGTVLSIQGFAFFIQSILSDEMFSNIVLKSSEYDKDTGGFSFSIVIGVNK